MISMKKTSRVSPRNIDAVEGETVVRQCEFEFVFVNMGQGDCTLVRCPDGKVGIIDCGTHSFSDSSDNLSAAKLKEVCDGIREQIVAWTKDSTPNVIDFLILTHADSDHNNKLLVVFPTNSSTSFTIKKIYFGNGPNATQPGSVYQDKSSYKCENVPLTLNPLSNYSSGLSAAVFNRNWGTEEVIEVVINNEVQCVYKYYLSGDKSNNEKGGRNSKYGEKEDIIENNDVPTYLIHDGDGWEVSIIAGNVLEVKDTLLAKRKMEARTEPPNKVRKSDVAMNITRAEEARNVNEEIQLVFPPYKGEADSVNVNMASLCTAIYFPDAADLDNVVLLMGDATNNTLAYLNNFEFNDSCVLSNIPHHGSNLHCNWIGEEVKGQSDFITTNLKPTTAIVSARPTYTGYRLPKPDVLTKYESVARGSDTHYLDSWYIVEASTLEWVETDSRYVKIIKDSSTWYWLKNYQNLTVPSDGLQYLICPKKGYVLKRFNVVKDVQMPWTNPTYVDGNFQCIVRKFSFEVTVND
tara:strand:+ start:918 stop:2480 length:1563 start_codon:yes stop_codon:yes gene_type:complete